MSVIFRKIGGRIIPIISKHEVATGAALVTGSAIAGAAIRRKIAEKTRGKGKTGFGNSLANFAADASISYGIIKGAQKIGGAPVTKSLSAFSSMLKKSVRGF